MRALLVLALAASLLSFAPPAQAHHVHCVDPDDPLTGPACAFTAAVLDCAFHRLAGEPCTLP